MPAMTRLPTGFTAARCFFILPLWRCSPAQDHLSDGGFDEVTELLQPQSQLPLQIRDLLSPLRKPCFSASLNLLVASINSLRSLSTSRLKRLFSRSCGPLSPVRLPVVMGDACGPKPQHLHCRVFHQKARPKVRRFLEASSVELSEPPELLAKSRLFSRRAATQPDAKSRNTPNQREMSAPVGDENPQPGRGSRRQNFSRLNFQVTIQVV